MDEIKKELAITNFDFLKGMLEHLTKAPRSEMEDYVKDKIVTFSKTDYTAPEVYDFLDGISKIPVTKTDTFCVGDISSFVQVACDVTKIFERPTE